MASPVRPLGLTVLHAPEFPEVDIIFVHGLQGHPERTWTWAHQSHESLDTGSTSETHLGSRLRHAFRSKRREMSRSPSPSPSPNEHQKNDLFWPRDLLRHHSSCKNARVMTYGYDTNILSLADTCNFTTLSAHGESLLNRVAAARADHLHRPLMFITHSLGGLVVKSALNVSRTKLPETNADLRAVVDSTFAIIFFGTPHRGSDYADWGMRVARAVSVLTLRPYNDKVVRSLASNTEILTNLRKDFVDTVDYMVECNGFESSTFQEGKGFSAVKGFTGKIVEDDSSEGGRNDRNHHVNRNHVEMCRFFGVGDPEYDMVSAEIKRHLQRIEGIVEEKHVNFLKSLARLGDFAMKRLGDINPRNEGTMKWLHRARAFKGENGKLNRDEFHDLETWLDHGPGLFWITGRPGSGKSTAMRFIYENAKRFHSIRHSSNTQTINDPVRQTSEDSSDSMILATRHHSNNDCCLIGLFITDRGAQEQRRWEPMLHGILLQLLKAQPALLRYLFAYMVKKRVQMRPSIDNMVRTPGMMEQEIPEWSPSSVMEALMHCKKQNLRPFRALITVDGLDELESMEDCKGMVKFLKQLSDDSGESSNTFRICLSSRSEEVFRILFQDTWRIEIHRHTEDDIRYFTWSQLSTSSRFTGMKLDDVFDQLAHVLDYVGTNAQGVFLWARSVVNVIFEALEGSEPLKNIPSLLQQLPTETKELYRYILRRIEPELRQRAFIMLEVVLRSRRPVTLLELLLIVEATEGQINGRPNIWSATSELRLPDIKDFTEPLRLQGQLIATCKCLLEVATEYDDDNPDYWSCKRRYELRSREFWVSRHEYLALGNRDETDSSSPEPSIWSISSGSGEEGTYESDEGQLLEMVSREQYRNYHDEPSLDPSRAVIRLLHRSAKEVLLDANFLDTLFHEDCVERKPPGNGHCYFLLFAREWLQIPQKVQQQLRCRFDPVAETIYHAALLEATISDPAPYFEVLDDIDIQAKITLPDRDRWPMAWYRDQGGVGLEPHWHLTFPAIAVAMDMRGYMEHCIRKAELEGPEELNHFLNGKEGRPLLHFSVYMPLATPKPEMTKFLVDKGVDLNLKFEGKTAIESLILNYQSHDHLQVMEYLVKAGADPNSRHYPDGGRLSTWHPLLHIVADGFYRMDLKRRIEFMRLLYASRADLNATDYLGHTFLEKLYWGWLKLPQDEWSWLLRKGAKITKSMVSRDLREAHPGLRGEKGFTGLCDGRGRQDAFLILHQPRFRRRDWYHDDAADAALSLIPTWFTGSPTAGNDRTPS